MTITWPATTFSPLINGQSRSTSLTVRKNQFGGGYQQRINQNLNQRQSVIQFTVFTNEQVTGRRLADLEALFIQSKGTEPFAIQFSGDISRQYVINSWKITPESPAIHMVSIEAELYNNL